MIYQKVENKLPEVLKFFCKDCQKLVDVTPVPRRFAYTCNICKTKHVAFGTEKSLKNFYRIKGEGQTMSEEEKKAINADKL